MDKEISVFAANWTALGWAGVVILLWFAWRSGDLARLKDGARLNLFLGAAVALMVMWQIRTGVKPGLSFHMLGASLATLMFGFWRGWLAASLAALAAALTGKGSLAGLGLESLIFCAVPAAVTHHLYRLIDRRLPNHFFIYVLANGFFGAALAIGTAALASTAVLAVSGAYALNYLLENYTVYFVLLAWSEALTTGMGATLMAVYRPEWLETFDDERYIKNK
ncbi:MAG: energy-coupling factor ABC transporter permease [Pseudomonadota bacterium]